VIAQRHDIAADVDERILDAVFPKKVRPNDRAHKLIT